MATTVSTRCHSNSVLHTWINSDENSHNLFCKEEGRISMELVFCFWYFVGNKRIKTKFFVWNLSYWLKLFQSPFLFATLSLPGKNVQRILLMLNRNLIFIIIFILISKLHLGNIYIILKPGKSTAWIWVKCVHFPPFKSFFFLMS